MEIPAFVRKYDVGAHTPTATGLGRQRVEAGDGKVNWQETPLILEGYPWAPPEGWRSAAMAEFMADFSAVIDAASPAEANQIGRIVDSNTIRLYLYAKYGNVLDPLDSGKGKTDPKGGDRAGNRMLDRGEIEDAGGIAGIAAVLNEHLTDNERRLIAHTKLLEESLFGSKRNEKLIRMVQPSGAAAVVPPVPRPRR